MEYHRDQLKDIMYFYKNLEKKYTNELAGLPAGRLICSKSEKKYHFYLAEKQNGRYIRRGITRRNDLISALARKEYLCRSLKLINSNINILDRTLNEFAALTPEKILVQMGKAYKLLPEQYFFTQAVDHFGEVSVSEIDKWINASFSQSTYNPQEKRHTTSRGLKVRSKSELLIAEKLYEFEIPFRYEQLLHIGERTIAPDFTINMTGRTSHSDTVKDPILSYKYWEHCGLTNSPQYMYRHKQKLELYERAGIVPWKNLIVTYDDEYGNIDLSVIESEIRNKL